MPYLHARPRHLAAAALALLPIAAAACGRALDPGNGGDPLGNQVRFAVIGDYGYDNRHEREVADLVKSWHPAFVLTLGDNNYPSGEARTIDRNIGRYYSEYIGGYHGAFGPGSKQNRFWPAIGNHDWYSKSGIAPYVDYFSSLPGNRRYYDVALGPVHLFAVDSDDHEPDGTAADSVQAAWLQAALARSIACVNVVFFHHPPYGSGKYVEPRMRWPFKAWGADVVMAGHDHNYERLIVDGLPYFVNGLGGDDRFTLGKPVPESRAHYDADYGALRVTAGPSAVLYEFFNIKGERVDVYSANTTCTVP